MKAMNIKRLTAMTAALMMCLSLISCGQNDASTADEAKVNSESAKGVVSADAGTGSGTEASSKSETVDAELNATDDVEYSAEADLGAVERTEKSMMKMDALEGDGGFKGEAAAPEAVGDPVGDPGPGEIDPGSVIDNDAKPFVLTAGEWKDNLNWGFFTNLVKNGTISYPVFGLDPTHRIAVTVTKEGTPAANQPVELVDSEGNVIWTASTDKDGMAYVFYKKDQTPALVRSGEASQQVTGSTGDDQQDRAGTTDAALEVSDSKKYTDTQVMFIIDTTGSMSDEIAYLQMDFSSIAKEVNDGHTTFSANFYRDEGDEYVTKCNPFTSDVQSVQSAINNEFADGGGDMPEAVTQILEETVTDNAGWSDTANKIAFLIFDAPPHEGTEKQLEAAVKTAAQKGIRLVPVVSSGADRDTELFGRAIAAQTGGSYVFLTDDSGVGGEHLEPIIGDYEVELLHDVIVRNINEVRG